MTEFNLSEKIKNRSKGLGRREIYITKKDVKEFIKIRDKDDFDLKRNVIEQLASEKINPILIRIIERMFEIHNAKQD